MDGKMVSPTIIRAFNSSWAAAPCLSTLSPLPSGGKNYPPPLCREVERKSRQAAKQVGVEWEREKKESLKAGGLKGFDVYLIRDT